MSNNKITGNQIIATRDLYGYFYRPTTIWDGCVKRTVNKSSDDLDWWALQSEIEKSQNQIVELMYDLYGVDACKNRQLRLFQNELKRQKNEDQDAEISNFVLSEEEYNLSAEVSRLQSQASAAGKARIPNFRLWSSEKGKLRQSTFTESDECNQTAYSDFQSLVSSYGTDLAALEVALRDLASNSGSIKTA